MFTEEQLLDPQFDETAYLSYLLHTSSASGSGRATEQTRLEQCMDTVTARIKNIFSEDADFLVEEVKATYKAHQEVEDIRRSTESLTRANNRLRMMVEEPFLNVQQRVQELENTTRVAETLEAVQKLLSLTARLKHYQNSCAQKGLAGPATGPSQSSASAGDTARQASPQELLRDARTLTEIECLLHEYGGGGSSSSSSGHGASSGTADLREIDVVEAQMKTTEQASTAIRGRVRELLNVQDTLYPTDSHAGGAGPATAQASSSSGTHAHALREDPLIRAVQHVGLALQCSHVLGTLPRTLQQFMAERKREVVKSIVRDLDLQRILDEINVKLQASGSAGGGGSRATDAEVNRHRLVATQEVLLTHIQHVLFAVVRQAQLVALFWCVLLDQEATGGAGMPRSRLASPAAASGSVLLIHTVESPAQLLSDFWQATMAKLAEALNSLQRRTELQVVLVSNYPRFHRILEYFLASYCAPLLPSLHTGARGSGQGSLISSSSSVQVAGGGGGAGQSRDGGLISRMCQLVLQNVPQCGMGDVLLVLEMVESECRRGSSSGNLPSSSSSASSSSSSWLPAAMATVRRLCSDWESEVAMTLQQRFVEQVMEHHQQRLAAVLNGLASITPQSSTQAGQAMDVSVRDVQHPALPPAANALQVQQYTQLVMGDVQAYHHDTHTVCLLLRCATRCLGQLLGQMRSARTKWPLPPLPSITAAITCGQLMQVCIANACTALNLDITNAIALLPAVVSAPASSARGGAASIAESATRKSGGASADLAAMTTEDDDTALGALRGQLWELTGAFRSISEEASHPFMHSLQVTIGHSLAYCVEQAFAHSNTSAAAQLRDQLVHFSAHFFFLFDARTSELSRVCRDVSDALLARLVVHVTTVYTATTPPAATRTCAQACLASISQALLDGFQRMHAASVGGGTRSRQSLLLRGVLKQTTALYAVTDWSSPSAYAVISGLLRSVPPLLSRLVLAQQAVVEAHGVADTSGFSPIPIAQRLCVKEEAVLDALQDLFLETCDCDGMATSTGSGGRPHAHTTPSLSGPVLQAALQTSFDEATRVLTDAAAPVAHTLNTLWKAVP